LSKAKKDGIQRSTTVHWRAQATLRLNPALFPGLGPDRRFIDDGYIWRQLPGHFLALKAGASKAGDRGFNPRRSR